MLDREMIRLFLELELREITRTEINEKDTMKLFLCPDCQDVVRCFSDPRSCKCGKCTGYYVNEIEAVFKGENIIPLGFHNPKLIKAMRMAEIENKHQTEPTTCKGVDFAAFIILDCSNSISKV